MKETIPNVIIDYGAILRNLVELRPPEFIGVADLPDCAKRWVYEGMANDYRLVPLYAGTGPYAGRTPFTHLFMGEIRGPDRGTKSVVAVTRRSLLIR